MAETLTNTNGAITLKQSTSFNRPFWFGTTAQTVTVTLSKNAAAPVANNGGAGAVTEIANGWYNVALTSVDTNISGVLAYHCTAGVGGPVDFMDIVQTTIFTDLLLDGTGRVFITSAYKQNTPVLLPFVMTVGNPPLATPGLAPVGQRNFGSGYSPIAGTITDLGFGAYLASLQAADTNAAVAYYHFTSTTPNANEQDITIYFQP